MPRKKQAKAQRALILTLPNETLQMIFSFVNLESTYYRRNVLHSVLLGLTHVCRRFRQAVHEASFWLEKKFHFADLVSPRPFSPERRCSSRWLRAILSDRYLQNCLQRKIDWTFNDAKIISIVLDTLPLFVDRARNVTFHMTHCHRLMSDFCSGSVQFSNLTNLNLDAWEYMSQRESRPKRSYDLDLIGPCFPALESFSITASLGIIKGTLNTFPHLEDFSIDVQWLHPEKTFIRCESPTALTRLSISCIAHLSRIDFGYFCHLQHFKVELIGFPEFRNLLFSMSPSNIISFEANVSMWVHNLEFPNPAPLITSPPERLHDIRLRFENAKRSSGFDVSKPGFEIDSLTWVLMWLSRLSSLKTFFIQAPADVIGALHLGQVKSLERLHWVLRRDQDYKYLIREDDDDVRLELDAFVANPSDWLQAIFESQPKPTIVVEHYHVLYPPKPRAWYDLSD
jgi:hypothetical protein